MNPALLLIAIITVTGIASWFLMPYALAALPQADGLLLTLTATVQSWIPVIQENWQLVTAVAGGTVMVGGYAANWLHKRGLETQKIEALQEKNDLQQQLFQTQGESLSLQNQLTNAQHQITSLENVNTSVADLTAKYEDAKKEVERVTAERNALNNIIPNVQQLERKFDEALKKP